MSSSTIAIDERNHQGPGNRIIVPLAGRITTAILGTERDSAAC